MLLFIYVLLVFTILSFPHDPTVVKRNKQEVLTTQELKVDIISLRFVVFYLFIYLF